MDSEHLKVHSANPHPAYSNLPIGHSCEVSSQRRAELGKHLFGCFERNAANEKEWLRASVYHYSYYLLGLKMQHTCPNQALSRSVVLFAVLKLKQTPDQEAAEVAARRAALSTAKQATVSAAQQLTESTAVRKSGRLLAAIRLNLRKASSDNLAGRLAIAGFVAICTAPVSSILLSWWALPIVALLYSLTDRPAIDVMRSLLRVNLVCTLLIAVLFTASMLTMESWRSEGIASHSPIGAAIHFVPTAIALMGTGISFACLLYLRRKSSRPRVDLPPARL